MLIHALGEDLILHLPVTTIFLTPPCDPHHKRQDSSAFP